MNNSSCSGNSRELIVRSFPEMRVQIQEFNFEKKLFGIRDQFSAT